MISLLMKGVIFAAYVGAANAVSPCSVQLAQIEQQTASSKASSFEGPSAKQTIQAQLHHQPTPRTVRQAEHEADVRLQGQLARARRAERGGRQRRVYTGFGQGQRPLRHSMMSW
jgi:hypothetical protein